MEITPPGGPNPPNQCEKPKGKRLDFPDNVTDFGKTIDLVTISKSAKKSEIICLNELASSKIWDGVDVQEEGTSLEYDDINWKKYISTSDSIIKVNNIYNQNRDRLKLYLK